jgi:hypothetical protein
MNLSKTFTLVAVMTPFILLALGGCKTSSFEGERISVEAARSSGAEVIPNPKLYLMPTKNEFCQIGPKNTPYFQNYLDKQKDATKVSSFKGAASMLGTRLESREAIEMCNVEIEDWILKSIALGKPAPYEVADLKGGLEALKAISAAVAVLSSGNHGVSCVAACVAIACDYFAGRIKSNCD